MFNSYIQTNIDQQVKIKMKKIRSIYLNKMVHAIFILAVISFPFAIYSYLKFSLQFINAVPAFILLTSSLLILLKKRISEKIKSYCISSLFVVIAVMAWFLYGVNGVGVLWLLLSCIIIMTLYGIKVFNYYIFSFLLYIVAISVFHLHQFDEYIILVTAQQSASFIWLSKILTVSTITVLMTYALYYLQSNLFILVNKITEQKAHIDHLANHDILTSLPTVKLADERLAMAMSLAKRNKHQVGVLFLDLDGFKSINDNYGHQVGDLVLIEVANRLKEHCRSEDTICRIGGDEFLIVLANIESVADIDIICQRLIENICQDILAQQNTVKVGASIGVAIYPTHSENAAELKSLADQAMYNVKNAGKNNYAIYND
jgi:diguanylate cyclase (GGDEF)-like protein